MVPYQSPSSSGCQAACTHPRTQGLHCGNRRGLTIRLRRTPLAPLNSGVSFPSMFDVSMCNQKIRHATLADTAEIASCLSALGYGTLPSLVAERLGLFAGSATDSVFVASESGHGPLLGVVSVHLLPLFHAPGLLGRITALAVKAEARGQGVGKSLVAAAEAWAWHAGAQRMEVTSGDHRPDAHMFYQSVRERMTWRAYGQCPLLRFHDPRRGMRPIWWKPRWKSTRCLSAGAPVEAEKAASAHSDQGLMPVTSLRSP